MWLVHVALINSRSLQAKLQSAVLLLGALGSGGPADPRRQPHPTPQCRPLAAVPARPPHTPQRCLQVRSRRAAPVPQLGATSVPHLGATSVASGHAYMPSPAAADASAARLRFSSMTGPKT